MPYPKTTMIPRVRMALGTLEAAVPLPWFMTQGSLPHIHGIDWSPSKALEFTLDLPASTASQEILRFILERHDGHYDLMRTLLEQTPVDKVFDGEGWHEWCKVFTDEVEGALNARFPSETDLEVIPRRPASLHTGRRHARFLIDLRLMLRRLAHYMSIRLDQRLEWQRNMLRTRALDERLKQVFAEGMETPDGGRFGGKGFRSTWQEGVVAIATALERDLDDVPSSPYAGDRVAPMIRDVGLSLAMGDRPADVFAAQMGKSGSNQNGGHPGAGGRDLHIGCWERGVLPPTAPLPIAAATLTGLALASQRLKEGRFHVACIGEGASSSGEFWEALNFAGARGLPITYVLQNNQIALDTPATHQSNVEVWADKGVAMGMPSWTMDGSDPAAWYASAAAAREFALAGGGPTLIHVETMRGCGHAHHHDDLYLGAPSGNPPGYVDRDLLEYWAAKDPIPTHEEHLLHLGVDPEDLEALASEANDEADSAWAATEAMPWPEPDSVRIGVTALTDADAHEDHLDRLRSGPRQPDHPAPLEPGERRWNATTERGGWTYARAIQQAMVAIADRHGDRTVFMGEDMEIAGAFGMNLPLRNAGHQDLLLDMPLSEAAIIHTASGAALNGMRVMAEIQFGGFAALAHNALVNNAGMLRWRWGAEIPLTVRIPLGAKTRSGPFHANMIESWYANDPGLIVVAPATPQDAYDLLIEASELDAPVLFLEHIGLYGLRGGMTGWGDRIDQVVDTDSVQLALDGKRPHALGSASVIRGGRDISLVTWGAMVHVGLHAATALAKEGIEVEIIDLRTLLPFDAATCVASVQRTGRLVVLHEGQWTGGLGHTIQSRILEEAFWVLEAPPAVIGALDTPVPFSPPLEDRTIPSVEHVSEVLRTLVHS